MFRAKGWLVSLLVVAGCNGDAQDVSSIEPLATLLPSLKLGVRAADFQQQRPEAAVDEHGVYYEVIRNREVWYYFWPKEPDRPAPLTSRLAAVETSENMYDSLRLRSTWRNRVAGLQAARGTPSVCEIMGDVRATLSRVTFVDSIRVSVTAEILRAEDGQGYEAYLLTRVAHPSWGGGGRRAVWGVREVECVTLGVTGARGAGLE